MTISKFCTMFAKGIESGEGHPYKRWQSCRVYVDGRTIYSYGSHFPMAYIIAPNVVWLNGDRFSVSTSHHQAGLRSAISTHAPEATVVIVPRSALGAANVDYQTIEPVDVHGERWEFSLQTSTTPPSDMTEDYPPHHYSGYGDTYSGVSDDNVGYVSRDGSWQQVRYVDGEYRWHTARHWLGDAVFRSGGRYFISSFDKQERRPLYFLSQLPGPVDTVDAAIESLAPESVKTAIEMRRNVIRQGDMFAIATGVTTRQLKAQGATMQKRKVTVEWSRNAREGIAKRDALLTVHKGMPPYPTRQYWQGHVQESRDDFRLVYDDWQRACDAWGDELVARYAEQFPDLPTGAVTRYGWQSTISYQPSRRWDSDRDVDAGALYGTAHTATEVATMLDGRQFARGIMYHDPAVIGQTRAADHRRQPLGKQWHLIARNTVPVNGTGRGRRAA